MGISPYMTAYQLWEIKTGRKIPENISGLPFVQRGILGEKVVRMKIEAETGFLWKPKTWRITDTHYGFTDDGWCFDLNTYAEVKCMGKDAHEKVRIASETNDPNGIPPHYMTQVQYGLWISKCESCWFISYRPEDDTLYKIIVKPDLAFQKKIVQAVDTFWLVNVQKDIPPALTDKDYKPISSPEYAELAEQYVRLKTEIKEREDALEALKPKLHAFVEQHPAISGHGLKIKRYVREGGVDYSKVPELKDVDLDLYRKKGSVVTEIRLSCV
jgi:predicted phage-related endonuclease